MRLFNLPILYFGLTLLLLMILPLPVFAQYGGNPDLPKAPALSVSSNVCVNGSPNINLSWSGVNQTDSFNIYRYEYTPPPGGDGLTGNYFDNEDLTNFKVSRIDPTIDFNWGSGKAVPEYGGNDNYSILWAGIIVPKYSERYTFYLTSDDGASLFVNNQTIIYNWTARGGLSDMSGSIDLTANQMYNITTTYNERGSDAQVHLEWRSSSQARQIVPKSALYSTSITGTQIASNLSQSARSYTDATALPNKLYSYQVVAVNTYGSASSSWTPYQLTQECSRPIIDNNSIISTCSGSPSSPVISFNFTDISPNRTSYNIYRQVQSTGQVTQFSIPILPKSFIDNSASLAPNTTYLYQVGGIDSLGETFSAWSNPVTTIADCSMPIINLFLTSNGVTKPYTDVPYLNIKQRDPVSISWNTTNAVTCTASIISTDPAPSQALTDAWSGNKATSSTGQALPEITSTGDYQFRLTCDNPVGVPNSSTITLTVTQLQKPYIQTTGGDVHTNESITIPR